VRHADLLVTDTAAHAEFFIERFGAARERTVSCQWAL
jgi:hypothetical protein